MATNYKILKNTEENIKKEFFDYLNHAYMMQTQLIELIKLAIENKDLTDLFKKIELEEHQSDLTQVNTIEELIWDISKDQPLLSHLRWYICVLISSSDIERICDYLFFMSRFIYQNPNISKNVLEISLNLSIELNKIFEEYISRIKDEKSTKKFFEEFKIKKIEYEDLCDKQIKKVAKKIDAKEYEQMIKFSFEFHSYYRIIERLENIIENLIFIHDTDFFRKKIENEEQF